RSRYHLSAAAEAAFRQTLQREMAEPSFANARSVRNELDRARLRHAYRLAAQPHRDWSREDLMRLEPEDMRERRDGSELSAGAPAQPRPGSQAAPGGYPPNPMRNHRRLPTRITSPLATGCRWSGSVSLRWPSRRTLPSAISRRKSVPDAVGKQCL